MAHNSQRRLRAGVFGGSAIATLAVALLVALSPGKAFASPSTWATGTWNAGEATCTCPTYYAGCKCVNRG